MNSGYKMPTTTCAFHENNIITHFCKYYQCLLPLCRDCLSIHRKQHLSKASPIQLVPIEEQGLNVHRTISQQVARLQDIYKEIINKLSFSNHLHSKLRNSIVTQKQNLINAIGLYYESMCKQVDLNYQRREQWLQEIINLYNAVRQEMIIIQNRLQGQKYLRTIIMWNKLHPENYIDQIIRQSQKQFEPPKASFCDIQQIITAISKSQKMAVLDLEGDMGFSQLNRILYTLRFGQEQNNISRISNKPTGISLISRESHSSHRIRQSKSSEGL